MPLPRSATSLRCLVALAALTLAVCTVDAQQQESEMERRIKHPNMDLHFEGFEKSFDTKASGSGKQAVVRPFGFGGRTVGVKGDGAFHARTFNDGRGNFQTGNFAVKQATAADRQALPQADRSFATRSVDVHEDRAATKSAAGSSRQYVNSEKPFLVPGKRQESLDDIHNAKNLNVEQIRELLNKNR